MFTGFLQSFLILIMLNNIFKFELYELPKSIQLGMPVLTVTPDIPQKENVPQSLRNFEQFPGNFPKNFDTLLKNSLDNSV